MVLKFIYTLFIGLLFSILVGVGIAAFYPMAKYPEYPSELTFPTATQPTAEQEKKLNELRREYDATQKEFMERSKIYSRNVSIITITIAVVALIISLTLFKQILIIADGLLLGGLFTLLYGIFRGFGAGDDKFRFVVVLVGFITSVIVGYLKFIKPTTSSKK